MAERRKTLMIALVVVVVAAAVGASQFLLWIDRLQAVAGQ